MCNSDMLIANRQSYSKDMDGKETSLILAGLSWTLREIRLVG